MNGFQKAEQLGLTTATAPGSDPPRPFTSAEIVGQLSALTAGAIPIDRVTHWFDREHLAAYDPIDGVWTGSLVDVIKSQSTPAPLVAGLRKLFVHIAKRGSLTIDTTDLEFAVEVYTMLGFLIQMGVVTAKQQDSFYALDGGRPYKDLTVEQYEAEAAEAAIALSRRAIIDACLTPIRAVRDAAGQRLNNATASLGPEHVDGLTLEELQALCDAITASADGNLAGGE
jgi:hypothetical protein